MDLRQMRYVIAVAESGSFRAAARSLHVAPQSLAEQIAMVEREIGAPLFVRSRSGVAPTSVGEVFIEHAATAVDSAERVLAESRAAAGLDSPGPVRIANALGHSRLTGDLVRQYLLRRPDADVRLVKLTSVRQIA